MAEALGIAAAILQVAGMGAKMSLTLHKIGVEVTTAGDQLRDMSRGISLFSQMLKKVGQTLRQEDSVHSPGAVETTQEIVEQCRGVYDQIQKMIDKVQGRDLDGYLRPIRLAERIRFCFQKTKVQCLLGELESLKLTLSTMIQVLYTGRLMAMFQQLQDLGNVQNAEKDGYTEEINLERDEVQSLVITRHWSLVRLSQLHSQVVQEQREASRAIGRDDPPSAAYNETKALKSGEKDDKRVTVFTEKSLAVLDASLSAADERPGELVLRAHNFVDYLLDRWTRVRDITSGDNSWSKSRKQRSPLSNDRASKQSRRSSAPIPKRSNFKHSTYSSEDSSDGGAVEASSKPQPSLMPKSNINRATQSDKPAQIRWWRGSHSDSRRTFVGNELASFKVVGSAWDRVTAASFSKDEWTDVPDSWISHDALETWNYEPESYQKKTGGKIKDRNDLDEPQGRDGEPITEKVHRVEKALTWTEVEDLIELTNAIRKRYGSSTDRVANLHQLVQRRKKGVDDLPYPDAPFGKLGHIAENFLKEGKQVSPDNINVLGSLIESKLSKKYNPEVVKFLKPIIFKTKDKRDSRDSDDD